MRYHFVLIISFLTLASAGQGFRVRHYLSGASTHLSKAIFESSPGNYITGGITVESVNSVSCNRLCIMGLNSQGQIIWTKKYGNNKFEYLNNNLITRSYYKQGNFMYYAGCARDSNNIYQGVLIKFNMNGDTLWRKIYRDSDPQEVVIPQMVTGSVDGGFLITGFFQNNSNTPYSKCMLIKTDANGNELWRTKTAKVTPNTQDGKAILQDTVSKKIVIVGYQYIGNATSWGNYESVLILDSLGAKLSQHNYAGYGGVLVDLIQTRDKQFVAVGMAIYPQTIGGTNLTRSYVVKFDVNSPTNYIWRINSFDKLSLTNAITSVVELKNKEILTAGIFDTLQMSNIPNDCLTRLTKIDTLGNIKSSRYYRYNTTPGDFNLQTIKSINLTSDGGAVAAIECQNFPALNPFFFVKFDSTGCDSTVAYCQSILSTGIYHNKSKELEVELFPNPVSDYLTVNIDNAHSEGPLQLNITDVAGREVNQIELSEENKIDLRVLANGVYLLNITRDKELLYSSKIVKQE